VWEGFCRGGITVGKNIIFSIFAMVLLENSKFNAGSKRHAMRDVQFLFTISFHYCKHCTCCLTVLDIQINDDDDIGDRNFEWQKINNIGLDK